MWHKSAQIICFFLFAGVAQAQDYQLHMRTGMVSGAYTGTVEASTGNFNVPAAIDIEIEVHQASQRSTTFRSTMAMDASDATMRYFYAGGGSRIYFWSKGRRSVASYGGTRVSIVPKLRHYAGVDVGIGNVQVKKFTEILGTYSTVLEFGGRYGVIYQVSPNTGIQLDLGTSYGVGFSSVSVTSTNFRALIGAAYYF